MSDDTMTPQQRQVLRNQRIDSIYRSIQDWERGGKPNPILVWLSFADPNRPEGQRFLGVSIVKAPILEAGPFIARMLGCNPDGEVSIHSLQDTPIPASFFEPYLNRLMNEAETNALNEAMALYVTPPAGLPN